MIAVVTCRIGRMRSDSLWLIIGTHDDVLGQWKLWW